MNTYNNEIKFKCFFNLHDFGDEKLNKLSKNILDLYFTYWAEEQFNGISGGANFTAVSSDIFISVGADCAAGSSRVGG